MIYQTRAADDMEECLTVVCKHDMEAVETDNGPCQRCRKCTVVYSERWWSPQVVIAPDTSPATA